MQTIPYSRREDIEAFLAARKVAGTFPLFGHDVQMLVHIPDLTGCTYSLWGDWGPMYTFDLEPDTAIRVEYRCPAIGLRDEEILPNRSIALSSPPMAFDRRHWPFYIDVTDANRGVRAKVFLDHGGAFSHLDVRCKPQMLHTHSSSSYEAKVA